MKLLSRDPAGAVGDIAGIFRSGASSWITTAEYAGASIGGALRNIPTGAVSYAGVGVPLSAAEASIMFPNNPGAAAQFDAQGAAASAAAGSSLGLAGAAGLMGIGMILAGAAAAPGAMAKAGRAGHLRGKQSDMIAAFAKDMPLLKYFGAGQGGPAIGGVNPDYFWTSMMTGLPAIPGVGSPIVDALFRPPTREHINLENIRDVWGKTGLWQAAGAWGDWSIMGRTAARLRGDKSAVASLLFPQGPGGPMAGNAAIGEAGVSGPIGNAAFYLGANALGGNKNGIAGDFANAFVNNARIMGLSLEQAQDQLLQFAEAAGIDLTSAITAANKSLMEGRESQDEYNNSIEALIPIFSRDLPAGVDAAAIALDHLDTINGASIVNVKELSRQVEIFGNLEAGVNRGIAAGARAYLDIISTGRGVSAATMVGQTLTGQGNWNIADITQQGQLEREARQGFVDTFNAQLRDAAMTAVSEGLLDAVMALDEYGAFTKALAAAIQGSAEQGLIDATGALTAASLGLVENAAATAVAIANAFKIAPTTLRGEAESIEAEMAAAKFARLTPRQQTAFQQAELARVRGLIAGGGEPGQMADWYGQERSIGEWYIAQSQQYAPHSARSRMLFATGMGILGEAKAGYEGLASPEAAITDNTAAQRENTAAVRENTSSRSGAVVVNITVEGSVVDPTSMGEAAGRIVLRGLDDWHVRRRVRQVAAVG